VIPRERGVWSGNELRRFPSSGDIDRGVLVELAGLAHQIAVGAQPHNPLSVLTTTTARFFTARFSIKGWRTPRRWG